MFIFINIIIIIIIIIIKLKMRTKSQISKNCDTARTLQYIGGRIPTFHTLEANNGHEMA